MGVGYRNVGVLICVVLHVLVTSCHIVPNGSTQSPSRSPVIPSVTGRPKASPAGQDKMWKALHGMVHSFLERLLKSSVFTGPGGKVIPKAISHGPGVTTSPVVRTNIYKPIGQNPFQIPSGKHAIKVPTTVRPDPAPHAPQTPHAKGHPKPHHAEGGANQNAHGANVIGPTSGAPVGEHAQAGTTNVPVEHGASTNAAAATHYPTTVAMATGTAAVTTAVPSNTTVLEMTTVTELTTPNVTAPTTITTTMIPETTPAQTMCSPYTYDPKLQSVTSELLEDCTITVYLGRIPRSVLKERAAWAGMEMEGIFPSAPEVDIKPLSGGSPMDCAMATSSKIGPANYLIQTPECMLLINRGRRIPGKGRARAPPAVYSKLVGPQ